MHLKTGGFLLIEKDTHTSMFTAALFATANTQKQPKCSLTDGQRQKMWYMYIQWSVTQPLKGMEFCHLGQHGWTSRALC